MRATWVVACIAVFLLAQVDGVSEEQAGVVVVDAADFMRSLHLRAPIRHRMPPQPKQVHRALPRLRGVPSSHDDVELGESQSIASTAVPHQHNLSKDLSRLQKLSSPSPAAQRKRDLAAAKRHFPKTEQKIARTREDLARDKAAVRAAKKRFTASKQRYQTKLAKADQVQDDEEFALMTDPNAETAAIAAAEKLQRLNAGYKAASRHQTEKLQKDKKQLTAELEERRANVKAVELFRDYQKTYEVNMAKRLATMSAKFHAKAMASAKKLAKRKFEAYKTKFLQKEEAMTNQQLKTQIAQRKAQREREAELEAEMDTKAKSEARDMFKTYVERFHETQQAEATRELELGEPML